jgi:tetratricopeptide (TPR) repeat protein
MVWVQVLLGGVSLFLAGVALVPVLFTAFVWTFRKTLFSQLNAEAMEEVRRQVEDHLKSTIDTEVEAQVLALTERIKKLNQWVQELEALVPASTQVAPSPEKRSQIDNLRLQIEDFQDLIPFLTQPAEYYFKQGNAFYFEKQYEEAIACYDKALEIKPDDSNAWTNRGVALSELKRYEEAIASYDKAIEIKPDFFEAWSNRGAALSGLKRYKEAIASYDKAIEIKPDYFEAYYNRGNALGKLGRYDEAFASYDKAIEIKPDYFEAYYNRGNALGKLGRYDEAIASHDKAIELKPNAPNVWYNRACCHALQGNVEETVHDLAKAIELDAAYRETAKTDSDFDKIRHDKRFQKLLNENL